jgi:hypothetical protein
MALQTLLGQIDPDTIRKLPGRVRNPDRIQQHINAFALHLQGVSYRGIQEHFGWKAVATAENSVKRGEQLAKDLGLDGERIRLKLANFFDELCDITLAQVKKQVEDGQVCLVADNQGNETITRRRGVDPRLLGEAGRGAIRFAQFCGLMDAEASTGAGEVSTNVIFVQPTGDGAQWDQLQTQAPTVDVSAMTTDVSATPEKAVQDNGADSCDRGGPRILPR